MIKGIAIPSSGYALYLSPLPLAIAAVLIFRIILAVFFVPGYLGVDGGAYLDSYNHHVLGDPFIGFTRPPLAPGWLLWPFIKPLGVDIGYKVFSALFSLAPTVPFYLLAKRLVGERPAYYATLFLLFDLFVANLMATGVAPLIGFAGILLAMRAVLDLDKWRWRFVLAAAIPFIALTNQTSAGLAAIVLPLWTIMILRDRWWTVLPWVGSGMVMALPLIPYYLSVSPGSSEVAYPGPLMYFGHWAGFGIVATVALFSWKHHKPLTVVALVLGFLSMWLSYDEMLMNIFFRAQHLAVFFVYILLAYSVRNLNVRWLWPTGLAVWAGVFTYSFISQSVYSEQASPEVVEAVSLLPEGSGVATNHFSLGHWVGALNRGHVIWAYGVEPPPKYAQSYQDLKCIYGWHECDALQAAKRQGVEYVLINERVNELSYRLWQAPNDHWQLTANAPHLTELYSKGRVRLYKIASY